MTGVGQRIVVIGATLAGIGVAIGAFGAHALEGRVSVEMLDVFETGARYHFYHSLGLIAVGLLASVYLADENADGKHDRGLRRLRWSAVLMLTGIVLFSGSLYTMAITDLRWLGAVTPLGGLSFLAAWGLLAWATADP
jgi:uncharacterized membrane protein YgdD (TMEM256/DUF423 family)